MARVIQIGAAALVAAVALQACSRSQESSPEPVTSATPAPAAAPARDLSALNLCEVIKPDEVAAAAAGKLATQPSWNGAACMYVIEVPSGTESYLISVYPSAPAEALLMVQSPEEKGEKIEGPWSEAWLGERAMGTGFTLTAVRRGDIAIEASGDRREVTLALGKLAGERVK